MNMVQKMSRDAAEVFWSRLPRDDFTEQEAELLELLHKVGKLLQSWMPPGISLQEWAQKRVPQEFALDINPSRLAYIQPPASRKRFPAPPASAPPAAARPRPPPPRSRPSISNKATSAVTVPRVVPARYKKQESETQGRTTETTTKNTEFFDSLPEDKMLPWEDVLHKTLAVCSDVRHTRLLSVVEKEPVVMPLIEANLPEGVSLTDWVERRAGDGIELHWEEGGPAIRCDGAVPKRELTQEFLDTFPSGEFTEAESNLRDAVHEFLEEWQQNHGSSVPATTQDLAKYTPVADLKRKVMPTSISLKAWCENRLFDEVEFMASDISGCFAVGLSGHMDHEAVKEYFASQPRKHTRQSNEPGYAAHE